jgi:hypothetical protein
MLRYFDLDEIVKFIKYVRESGYAESCYFVENYFKDIREITMTSIKLYYLCLLNSIAEPDWATIRIFRQNATQNGRFNEDGCSRCYDNHRRTR